MLLGCLAIACVLTAAAIVARLHRLPTGIDPVPGAVSDYGTTAFHIHYRAMAVLLGLGAALLALGLARDTDAGSLGWLWAYAGSRVAIAGFMTDRDPPPFTPEGRIHWVLAAVAFTSIAFAASNVDWTGAPGGLRVVGYAVTASALATLATRVIRPLRVVFGVAERLLYVTSVAWLVFAAISLIGA